ncbi:MAG: polysaccharide deacetylase family protein [Verrucomicrobiales bacterium]
MPSFQLLLASLAACAILAACTHRDDRSHAATTDGSKPVGTQSPVPGTVPDADAPAKIPSPSSSPRPSGPPPQNPNTAVRVDLSRAKATTYHSVSTGGNHIALTFDDGPHKTNTPRLLDILKERNIKATFFVVGPRVKSHPAIVRRMIAEGHEVANHTMTHGDLSGMTDAQIRTELDGCQAAIVAACGVTPRLMRAPYGSLKNAQKIFIKDTWGYPNIHWSVDPKDHERPGPSVVANRIVSNTRAGGIVLVHDIHAPSIVAMPQALDGLLSKGFSFVTVSQLISLGNKPVASVNTDAAPSGS